jgi:hypothetical protein
MTSEKEKMTSDQEVMTSNQVGMTSDQEVKTSDQEVMMSDQEVMTSDQEVMTSDQEVNEPSGSPTYSMQFDNPAFRTDASDPISCGGKNSDDDMSTSTTTTTRCIREKAVWELNEKVNKGSWDAIPMDNVRRIFFSL